MFQRIKDALAIATFATVLFVLPTAAVVAFVWANTARLVS